MAEPERPTNETDRLIEATREEAHKTRTLLVWLLVGIPVIALVVWGLVAGVGYLHAQSAAADAGDVGTSDTDTYVAPTTPCPVTNLSGSCVQTTEPTVPPAIAAFTVTDTTRCSTIDDWFATNGNKGPINPQDAAIYDGASQSQLDGALTGDPVAVWLSGKGANPAYAGQVETDCVEANGQDTVLKTPDETVAVVLQHAESGS